MNFKKMIKSFKLFIIILLFGLVGAAKAQELTIYVDNWPPYNFIKNDKIVGISTELIEAALQRANIQYKLVKYPFKRGLATVRSTPYTMLYTAARIPQREDEFAWIGPLHPRKVYLFKLSNRTDIQINELEDIKKYRTGVLSGGSVEQFFIDSGLSDEYYHLVNYSVQLLKMLLIGRFDLIPGDPLDLAYQMKSLGSKYSELEVAYLLSDEGGYYMVANKETPVEILVKIQESLEEVIATGLRDRVIEKYLR
ncbi:MULTISPECIES: transporter substrate-binding domain-containing protein [unclassified Pseudodesulfovibrio]|uniref:substrate-binding periplasmic protein n=1 Tax=unclassified Pseudodesulfovibrio TaxID=2661612 RepID=UPI000FEB7040|nr:MULTISPECIES: transporter substrate-binding domain-containing protein [unclassified Pseudodesulfovibrio]MCJ2163795.1 transporter substrate-binding domain-containing protein [Pseudodesulfovibrio sp. S3-i]RWU05957.1 hypothetical protein DWB63_04600 [Pseudodesulfovibrio sp. S3]